jgi:hypothetical protein
VAARYIERAIDRSEKDCAADYVDRAWIDRGLTQLTSQNGVFRRSRDILAKSFVFIAVTLIFGGVFQKVALQ